MQIRNLLVVANTHRVALLWVAGAAAAGLWFGRGPVMIELENTEWQAAADQASADAYPDQRLAAERANIPPGVDGQRGSVEAEIAMPKPPRCLRQVMTVSVGMQLARRPMATLAWPGSS